MKLTRTVVGDGMNDHHQQPQQQHQQWALALEAALFPIHLLLLSSLSSLSSSLQSRTTTVAIRTAVARVRCRQRRMDWFILGCVVAVTSMVGSLSLQRSFFASTTTPSMISNNNVHDMIVEQAVLASLQQLTKNGTAVEFTLATNSSLSMSFPMTPSSSLASPPPPSSSSWTTTIPAMNATIQYIQTNARHMMDVALHNNTNSTTNSSIFSPLASPPPPSSSSSSWAATIAAMNATSQNTQTNARHLMDVALHNNTNSTTNSSIYESVTSNTTTNSSIYESVTSNTTPPLPSPPTTTTPPFSFSRNPVPAQHQQQQQQKHNDSNHDDDGVAACLLIKDDNHFLIEWMAYHYHVMPLRYLVIAVDPTSQTSPDSIVDRWKHLHMNMNFTVWKRDGDFMSKVEARQARWRARRSWPNDPPAVIAHRARQRVFYDKCMRHHKRHDRHWAMFIDTDEYVRINYETLQARQHEEDRDFIVPPITQPGSVLTLLQQAHRLRSFNLSSPCIQIPRSRFGGQESPWDRIQQQVPEAFNASAFQTMRWRKHAGPDKYLLNRISKVMIDLSRVSWMDLLHPVDSIHRPVKSICLQSKLHIRAPEQILLVHHYLGTKEQYQYRNDPRVKTERNDEKYRKAARVADQTDDTIRPWLQGFVQTQSQSIAEQLLHRVGDLDPVSVSTE